MKNQNDTTGVEPKCDVCGQKVGWQHIVHFHNGIVTYVCKNCKREYEKILAGEINKYTQRG